MLARVIVVATLGSVALATAAPKYARPPIASTDPDIVAAERLWQVAAAERDPQLATAAWEKAADGFLAVVNAGKVSTAEQKHAAFAALQALKNALHVDPRRVDTSAARDRGWMRATTPQAIPAREQRFLRVVEVYRRFDRTSDDAIGAWFLQANILRRYHHDAEANPIFLAILDHHRDHEVAEYAANLLLDSYNRLGRYDDLVALAERLLADRAFVAKHPDLGNTLGVIRHQSEMRKAAELEHTAREHGDLAYFDRCGDAYLALADGKNGDEMLAKAILCYREARSPHHMREAAALLERRFPRSILRDPVVHLRFRFESETGSFAEAAAAAERLLAVAPAERTSVTAAQQAVGWRIALGELDQATRLLDTLARLTGPTRVEQTVLAAQLIEALLAAGRRRDARHRARRLPKLTRDLADAGITSTRLVRLLADASCPVALVDELCPQPRDRALVGRLRDELRAITSSTPGDRTARRIQADLELERALAKRKPPRRDDLAAFYRSLLDPAHVAADRVAAHARLALLAARAGTVHEADAHLRGCITEARAAMTAASWIRSCERERARLKLPPIDPLVERLPAAAAPVVTASEPPLPFRLPQPPGLP